MGSASSTRTRWCTARRPRNSPSTRFPLPLQLTSETRRAEPPPPFSIHLERLETETAVSAELILHNAKIATNGVPSFVEALTVSGGRIAAAGTEEEILRLRGPQTRVIHGRRR